MSTAHGVARNFFIRIGFLGLEKQFRHAARTDSAFVAGYDAANRGLAISKMVLYEAPFIVDDTHPPLPGDYLTRLRALIAANRRGDAVKMFLKLVGVPAPFMFLMRLMPVWPKLVGIAHTLVYDISIVAEHQTGQPFRAGRWASATMPTIVADGGKSPAWMRNANRSLAGALPNATYAAGSDAHAEREGDRSGARGVLFAQRRRVSVHCDISAHETKVDGTRYRDERTRTQDP